MQWCPPSPSLRCERNKSSASCRLCMYPTAIYNDGPRGGRNFELTPLKPWLSGDFLCFPDGNHTNPRRRSWRHSRPVFLTGYIVKNRWSDIQGRRPGSDAAQAVGSKTRFASLKLHGFTTVGNCDSGTAALTQQRLLAHPTRPAPELTREWLRAFIWDDGFSLTGDPRSALAVPKEHTRYGSRRHPKALWNSGPIGPPQNGRILVRGA